ncbi:hypothetical protein [Streptomyces qinzhouensis]|uniref:Uncharacterized protein n=1 Tax=Streptomyces qinzhouensis TaxID=2599401 RepID=A0A5B8J806_9ACTN|nr:hypothetical protein [Streptomyces qinzhouensis]QDY76031.1 hypothetical protein FQU76_05245 [Streptomyces qinzhouensis]
MAGFRSLARQVRDPRCDLALRRYSLRKCLERFAPYGHRATWDHLCARHGFGPEDRSPDPAKLIAALDELERARDVWLAYEEEFADRRKREKHDGLRRPASGDEWHQHAWGGNGVARCDSPRERPSAPLDEVLRKLVTALTGEPGAHCPVCGASAIVWRQVLKTAPWAGPVCTGCGIVLPRPVLTDDAVAAAQQAARHTVLASVA